MDQATKLQKTTQPITLNLTIEPASLKKVIDQGRLTEFVDTLSTLAAAHIRAQIINATTGAVNGVKMQLGFDDDDRYGTGPHPWPHHFGTFEAAMREKAITEIAAKTR